MSKFIKRLRKTQSEVAIADHPSAFLSSHRNKSFNASHAMKSFEEEAEIQIDPLPTPVKDPIVLIKEGDLAGLKALLENMQLSVKYQDETGFTLLHCAASHNQLAIIQYLLDSDMDANQIDIDGNTPLHLAIKNGHTEAMECLLDHKGIDTTVVNSDKDSPFHTAIRFGSPELVRAYMSHPSADYFVKGKRGRIAFHLAAELNKNELVEVILEFAKRSGCSCNQQGAFRLCAKDDDDLTPLHVAARSGSARSLDTMIAHAQGIGYPVEKVLSFLDEENSTPLHSAVDAGYTEVVEVLMKYGASPIAMEGDQPSPLHQAAFLGSISVLKALGKGCTLDQLEILNLNGRTPLHVAAFSSRNVECVQYFIYRGCDVNFRATDSYGGTPLIAAVCSGALASVKVLLKSGANPLLQTNDGGNALHLAIQKGRRSIINEFLALPSDVTTELVTSCNNEGMNALHYAIINNQREVAQDIIMKKKVCCYAKTNDNLNIIHLAADIGKPQMMSLVLSQTESFNLINEGNNYGGTALHLAAGKGHLKCVEMLLDKGAMIHRCHAGFSPFLYACYKGFSDVARVLLEAHPFQLNWLNDDGDSALHVAAKADHAAVVKMLLDFGLAIVHNADHESFLDIAIKNGNKDITLVAVQHSRWEECLKLVSPKHPSPMLFLVERIPDVAKVVLDRCLTTSSFHLEHSDYWMRYDFQFLVEKPYSRPQQDKGYDQYYGNVSVKEEQRELLVTERRNPLSILRSMLCYKRLVCLTHPVLVEFLKYKWQLYGKKFLLLRLLLILLLVILLSVFIGSSTPPREFNLEHSDDPIGVNYTSSEGEPAGKSLRIAILVLCLCETLLSCCTIYFVARLRQAFGQILPVISFSACSIVSIYVFLIPPDPIWEAGVVAIITTWLYVICSLQFYEGIGIYVIMLLEVTYSLLRVITFAVLMFVAFGLAFHILIGEISQYSTPGRAMFTVLVSMVEGIATKEIVDKDSMGMLSYPGLTYIAVIVMSFLLPVIMINLFIGLAVGNIEKVRENATVTQRQLQIALYTFVDPIVSFFAPHSVNREFIIVTPNKHKYFSNKWLQWLWFLWQSSKSAVNLVENNTEETDKYIEQELRISKIEATMMEMENQLHMLMEQQQKQMEVATNILDLLKERKDVH